MVSPALVMWVLNQLILDITKQLGGLSEDLILEGLADVHETVSDSLLLGYYANAKRARSAEPKPQPDDIHSIPPFSKQKKKPELYCDVMEEVACIFDASGNVKESKLKGHLSILNSNEQAFDFAVQLNPDMYVLDDKPNDLISLYESHPCCIEDLEFNIKAVRLYFDHSRRVLVPCDSGERVVFMKYKASRVVRPPFKPSWKAQVVSTDEIQYLVKLEAANVAQCFHPHVKLSWKIPHGIKAHLCMPPYTVHGGLA